MRPNLHAVVAILVALAIGSCSRSPRPPAAPAGARLVVLSPALAVTLKDLGLENRIVGRHAYDLVLDEKVPVCGDQAGIDYETLLSVSPTHVLIEWGSRPLPARLEELAVEHHWAIRNYSLLTLDQVRAAVQQIAREFPVSGTPGRNSPGPGVLAAEMDRAWSTRGAGFAGAGKILLLHSTSPPAALGPGSFHQQILERIGGNPAITQGSPFIELDAEDVLRLAPVGIVLVMPRARNAPARTLSPADLTMTLGPLAGLDIPAIKNGRVSLIDDPLCALPSTSMIRFADELARVLDGWSKPR